MFAPEGWPFIFGGAAFCVASRFMGPRWVWLPLFAIGVLFTLFSMWFFRNPARALPEGEGLIVSPADGEVVHIGDEPPGRYMSEPGKRVSIFMSPMNVHVNRAPVSGRVSSVRYNKGEFHVARVEKASLMNEQNGVEIVTPEGRKVTYVQIAGILARRIVCDVREGDEVTQGRRVGMIRFGSRLDVYLPRDARINVAVKDRVRAGETVIGAFQ